MVSFLELNYLVGTMSESPSTPMICSRTVAASSDSRVSEEKWSTAMQPGTRATPASTTAPKMDYLARLSRFYAHYNPEKLDRAPMYLQQFTGKEETLFAILIKKYGPEDFSEAPAQPAPSPTRMLRSRTADDLKDLSVSASRYGSRLGSDGDAAMHYSGKRVRFPKFVSPEDGKTDMETPYWANPFSPITDRDLMGLLSTGHTDNVELLKCYMGYLSSHPRSSWNGLVYCTDNTDVATAGCVFLGHRWAASLGYRKKLIHAGEQFTRETLFCTEECQKSGGHEQWRISIYRRGNNPTILLRTIWDPVIAPEPLPQSHLSAHDGEMLTSADIILQSQISSNSDRSGSTSAREPMQPNLSACIGQLVKFVAELDSKLTARLNEIDGRLARLERMYQDSNGVRPTVHEIQQPKSSDDRCTG